MCEKAENGIFLTGGHRNAVERALHDEHRHNSIPVAGGGEEALDFRFRRGAHREPDPDNHPQQDQRPGGVQGYSRAAETNRGRPA
jgi:hypothetical protein